MANAVQKIVLSASRDIPFNKLVLSQSNVRRLKSGISIEELIAEISAAFLCASLGIAPTVRHADYIGSWLEVLHDDNKAIVRAASAASKAADFILGFAPDSARTETAITQEDEQVAA